MDRRYTTTIIDILVLVKLKSLELPGMAPTTCGNNGWTKGVVGEKAFTTEDTERTE